ncbi:glycosyltransferase [Marivita hallyeonensis]|uniref:glycosyltransferase n=1 Tax=Marivita hallyeonensis TaxID=996342 RepID=UPI001FE9D10A|nr:glycosyltransferase [Marivita hallyeonensis]
MRTKLGYLLLDKKGCAALLAHCDTPKWQNADLLSKLSGSSDTPRAATESGLRKIAVDRATAARLRPLLQRHLPSGAVYLNVGQTNFNDRLIHALRACDTLRIAVYLHDTIPLDWPDLQTQKSRLKFKRLFDRVDRHADLVLCNSQDTKMTALRHARGLTEDKVHVIWPGLPEIDPGHPPKGPWTDKPYFMAIGTIEPRKNIGFLLDMWEDFREPDSPHLLICGRRGWLSEDVFARLDNQPGHVHELPDLPDPAMWALLKNSCGLLFPSIVEGFGYPAMEAAHLGVPVICNALPSVKEVLDDYPIYADSSDSYLWMHNIKQLAQGRRGQSGEQLSTEVVETPDWQAHFNRLFTIL